MGRQKKRRELREIILEQAVQGHPRVEGKTRLEVMVEKLWELVESGGEGWQKALDILVSYGWGKPAGGGGKKGEVVVDGEAVKVDWKEVLSDTEKMGEIERELARVEELLRIQNE
jgi:hypothetical protein